MPGTDGAMGQTLALSQKRSHTAPRGLRTKLRMPDATIYLFRLSPTPIQHPTERRAGG